MMEFTTKQIAELLGVSKPTVQKAIKALAVEPARRENNNRAYYSYADAVSVIKVVRPDFDFSLLEGFGAKPKTETAKPPNEAQNIENPQNLAQNSEAETAKPPNAELDLLRNMLAVIQEQLQEKDKQLSIKDKQIQDLSDRLAEAMQLTRGQQYIAAADKTTELLEADNRRAPQQEEHVVVPEDQTDQQPSASSGEEAENKEPLPKKSFWQRIFGK